ncbi:asparagine synthase (glutamine-hydrolyzing) [Ferrovibrio xuzhouensis]|uniref:asparagine synthase (glutamine-hydrolyzing) n=1 Tax=Ferrovibrio xuzhouensis TaxID=1576914 RepID=A0ABV7VCJ1_9PROT
MCGITGYLNFGNRRAPDHLAALIGRMNAAVAHRGPDDRGQWHDPENYCHLGHTRLSIIDLSSAGHQPMHTADERYVITFNGEIYNFQALRRLLEKDGAVFRTATDTEVLLNGFALLGTRLFEYIDGMYALAIFDRETRCLTLARDRAGEKPLYYAATDSLFAFASELRPLLEIADLPVALSEEALAQYFTFRYVPEPDSMLAPIRKLEPGMMLQVFSDGRQRRQRHFSFVIDQDGEAPASDIENYTSVLEKVLTQALRDRLNSDVPLGMFLSSGVDSSLACALLTKELGQSVKTFTIGFEGDPQSEHRAARDIAATLGAEHHEHIFSAADFDRICDDIGQLLDEPNGDRSCVPTYLLAEFTRKHVTVAISGDAGDELYGGYGRYPAFAIAYDRMTDFVPSTMVQTYIERGLPVTAADAVRAAFPQGYAAVQAQYEKYAPLFMHPQRPALHALRQLDFNTYLPGAVLAKVDRMSMRHGLETRTPYLYPTVIKLAAKASQDLCMTGPVQNPVQKVAMRHLLARYLPQQHVQAPKKGFGMPLSVFFNNKPRIEAEMTAAYRRLADTRFFGARPGALDRLFAGIGGNINAVWAGIVLARWIDSVERPL